MGVVSGAAADLGLQTLVMPSGAVHDAQNLAQVTDAGMIFVPSKGGLSHRPDEWTDWEHLEQGANVLLLTVLLLNHLFFGIERGIGQEVLKFVFAIFILKTPIGLRIFPSRLVPPT